MNKCQEYIYTRQMEWPLKLIRPTKLMATIDRQWLPIFVKYDHDAFG